MASKVLVSMILCYFREPFKILKFKSQNYTKNFELGSFGQESLKEPLDMPIMLWSVRQI